ncbi:MAG: hypothetical protein JST05_03940 [Acidobacteria bacterium]|nr:hypothetical protein [Acidobacteriota bacterium]
MRKAWILPLGLVVIAASLASCRAWRHPDTPERVLLLTPVPGEGLDEATADVLGSLLTDELETRANLAVTNESALAQPFLPDGPLIVVRPLARREGDRLALSLEWAEMGPGLQGGWHRGDAGAMAPSQAIESALRNLPLQLSPPDPALLPRGPDVFWALLEADSAVFRNQDLDGALDRVQSIALKEPNCAYLHETLAHIDMIRTLQDAHRLDGHVEFALAAVNRALTLSPGYPRALRNATRLLSDQGQQAEAMTRLQAGLQRHPRSLNLLFALDYAARTAGLMDIALAARARIATLWAGAPDPPPTGFSYLYGGQMDAFEASFRPFPGETVNGFTAFYLGYADLLRNRPADAEPHFQAVEQNLATEDHYRRLAKVFRFAIEGKRDDARTALDLLDRDRVGLQVPDGEFTFTMAEAAGYLEEEGRAMDLAQRAFSQGFTCSDWYRASPFLAKVQSLPRWRAILQHVDARRARVAGSLKPKDFGL